MRTANVLGTVLGGVAAAALLGACGGGGFAEESPETITSEAEKAMKDLSSLRMAGDITTDGEQISLDIALTTDGDCEGEMALGEGGEASVEILSVGGETWLKPSEAFWEQFAGPAAEQITAAAGDKWVVLPGDQAGNFAELCDLDQLLDEFGDDEESEKVEVGETEEVDGQEAVTVTGESDEGDPTKAWVATDEPHHILQLEVTEGDEPGTITFTDFDEDFALEAPAESDVFDLEQLTAPS